MFGIKGVERMKYKMIRRSFLKRPCLKYSINHWFKWKDYLDMYESNHVKHNRQHHIRRIKSRDYGRLYSLTRHDLLTIRKLREEIRTGKWKRKETTSEAYTA